MPGGACANEDGANLDTATGTYMRYNGTTNTIDFYLGGVLVFQLGTGGTILAGGAQYVLDTGTGPNAGQYWKMVVQDGVFDVQGPSSTIPF